MAIKRNMLWQCGAKVYENSLPLGSKVEELPMELIPFSREPYYDLDELVQEVIDEQFGGTYEGISSINWTDRAYKQYYGKIYFDDMVEDARIFDDVLPDFLNFIGDSVLVGHNIHAFDMKFLYRESGRLYGKTLTNDYVDTLYYARKRLQK